MKFTHGGVEMKLKKGTKLVLIMLVLAAVATLLGEFS